MAKSSGKTAKTAIKTKDKGGAEAKNYTKVIRAVKGKNGNYTFKEAIIHKDQIKDFLANG